MVGYQLPHAVSIVVVSTELEMKCAVLYFPITRIFFRLFFFTVTKYQLSRNMWHDVESEKFAQFSQKTRI